MATLYVGSRKVLKGVEYANLTGAANAMQTTEKTNISINHSPFAEFPAYTKIFIAEQFHYLFEIDTVILLSNEIEPDLYKTTTNYSTADVPLSANIESTAVVSVVDSAGKEITEGDIYAFAYVDSTSNQPESVIIRIHGDTVGLLHTSTPITINANSWGTNCSALTELNGITLPAGESVSYTVEATNSALTVRGSDTASQISLQRKNL